MVNAYRTYEVVNGSKVVRISTNDGSKFWTRLYVNGGETATLTIAKAKTLDGAQKQAQRMLRGSE
jgi:hypothetical protein